MILARIWHAHDRATGEGRLEERRKRKLVWKRCVDPRGWLAGWLLVNVASRRVLVRLLLVFALDG